MKLSGFDYALPKELIAQYPLNKRAESRLMVLDRRSKTISHRSFKELSEFFQKGDSLILNDTKVIPARLIGKRNTGGKAEVFILSKEDGYFRVLMRPLKKLKTGGEIYFDNNLKAKVIAKDKVEFNTGNLKKIYSQGLIPLPPYIKRAQEYIDRQRYQTIFAKNDGAVAAPTAGLHFDNSILKTIGDSGVDISFITLHIGLGTFKPIKSESVVDHKMEYEYYKIPKNINKLIEERRKSAMVCGGRIFACGTTVTRALETVSQNKKLEGKTNLFIYPGFKFNIVDCLITNFHLPKSTLFLLVCAFAGRDFIMEAYEEAIKAGYRFYSYGDCMLIL